MQAFRDAAARRVWTNVQSRVSVLQGAPLQPSMGEVFRAGFMQGSMLQLAVCTPTRRARTAATAQVLVTDVGKARRLDRAVAAAG